MTLMCLPNLIGWCLVGLFLLLPWIVLTVVLGKEGFKDGFLIYTGLAVFLGLIYLASKLIEYPC